MPIGLHLPRRISIIMFVGMNHLVLVVLFELPISLFETLEVVEEEEQVANLMVTFNILGGDNLALLEFFLLNVLDFAVNTKNVNCLGTLGIKCLLELLNLRFEISKTLIYQF